MPLKTVLITGCGPSGIGLALAQEFHLRGHRVIASGLSEALLDKAKALGMETVVMDVTSEPSIAEAVAHVQKFAGGRLDILINNAGRLLVMPLADTTVADARQMFEVNVIGTIAVSRAFLPLLLAGDGESVVANLGSINQVLCPPFHSVYNATKAAVETLGHSMRTELAPLGVRVVTLKTGSIKTDLFNNAPSKLPEGSLYAPIRDWIEQRRFTEAATFMDANEYAKYVVAQLLRPSVKKVIWYGGLTTITWILSWLGWTGMLVSYWIPQSERRQA